MRLKGADNWENPSQVKREGNVIKLWLLFPRWAVTNRAGSVVPGPRSGSVSFVLGCQANMWEFASPRSRCPLVTCHRAQAVFTCKPTSLLGILGMVVRAPPPSSSSPLGTQRSQDRQMHLLLDKRYQLGSCLSGQQENINLSLLLKLLSWPFPLTFSQIIVFAGLEAPGIDLNRGAPALFSCSKSYGVDSIAA